MSTARAAYGSWKRPIEKAEKFAGEAHPEFSFDLGSTYATMDPPNEAGELRAFNRWNPYERKDPKIKGSHSGPATGVGSRYAWESDEVGVGSLEITGQQPGQAVQMRLDFIKPFEAHNLAEFRLVPQADGSTEVIWAMHGPSPYLSKLMGVIFNMDKMIGTDFEVGLQNLKALAEKPGTP